MSENPADAKQDWKSIGRYLLEAEESGTWRQDSYADSFSVWLFKKAPEFGLRPPSLWKMLAAVKYYDELRTKLGAEALPSLAPDVGPEKLELLGKLERILSHDQFKATARSVCEGSISRNQLREMWTTYRPALRGQTARGRGAEVPQLDTSDVEQVRVQEAARILHVLARDPVWADSGEKPYAYGFYSWVEVEHQAYNQVLDGVFALQSDQATALQLHVAHVITSAEYEDPSLLADVFREQRDCCHHFWLSTSLALDQAQIATVPSEVGVVVVSDSVQILRKAQNLGMPKYGAEVYADLLSRELRQRQQ